MLAQGGERGPRVAQVLEHVGEEDHVDAVGQLFAHRGVLDVTLDDLDAAHPRLRRGGRVGLHPHHPAAPRGERRGEVAARASHVEHARPVRHRVEHEPVAV